MADEQAKRRSSSVSGEPLIAQTSSGSGPVPPPPPPPPPPPAAAATPAPVMAEVPQSVIAFDEMVVDNALKPFVELTRSLGGESLIKQVRLVTHGTAHRSLNKTV